MPTEAFRAGDVSDQFVIMAGAVIPIGGSSPGSSEETRVAASMIEDFSLMELSAGGGTPGYVIVGGAVLPTGPTILPYIVEETLAAAVSTEEARTA